MCCKPAELRRSVATAAVATFALLALVADPATSSATVTGKYAAYSENGTIVIDVEGVASSRNSLRECNVGVSWNGVPSGSGNGRYTSAPLPDGTYLVSVACTDSDGLVVVGPPTGTIVVVDVGGWSKGPGVRFGF